MQYATLNDTRQLNARLDALEKTVEQLRAAVEQLTQLVRESHVQA